MKRILISLSALFLVLVFAPEHAAWAASDAPQVASDLPAQSEDTPFTPEELHDLLAPIALYPDPLIAQILPAATFIDQVDEAARYVRQYGKAARIDDQPWDVSVRAVAHYPDVLFMMDRKYDWTVSLGQAFINQQRDVMDAIQRLRAEAQTVNNLVSTPQQQVIQEGGIISIVPVAPDVIYIPQYDPLVVYWERPYTPYGFVTFGIGFTIGVWLNRDCDWHRQRVFYHGWRGGGWIGRARPHIHDRNRIYINNRHTVINVNPRVKQHDTRRFREDIRRDLQQHRELGGRPVPGIPGPPRGKIEGQGSAPHPALQTPAPAVKPPRPSQRPDARDLYRGREPRGIRPAPATTGYGGYGSGRDAQTYRERGQSSREHMRQPGSQPPTPGRGPAVAPPQRQKMLGGKPVAPPSGQQGPRQTAPGGSDRGGKRSPH